MEFKKIGLIDAPGHGRITKTRSNANVGVWKTKYAPQRIPCVKMTCGLVGHLKFARLAFFIVMFFGSGITGKKWILAAKSTCTTLVASFSGGIFATLYSLYNTGGKMDVLMIINGILGSLVGITGMKSIMNFFDPRGCHTVTAGNDHYFRTCCLYVRPYPHSKSHKRKQLASVTVGLAEWIIDGTHVLYIFIRSLIYILAGCALVSPREAVFIGIVGSFLALITANLLIYLKVDDAVGATCVHGKF